MDYFKVPYTAYVILIICVVIISFLKLLLSNKLILTHFTRKTTAEISALSKRH